MTSPERATGPEQAEDAPWLSADQLRSWLALTALLETLPAAIDAQLKRDAGMNLFEYVVMARLSEEPGRVVAMRDLATFAAGSLSRLSHAVDRLERQGWVERRPRSCNPRHTEVVLTDAGLDKIVRSAPGHVREVRRLVIDTLTDEQTAQLGRIARAIVGVVAPEVARLLDQGSRRLTGAAW
ncbi:MAG: MarR family transcriptional regulator [Kineosporiaceae bacterium]